MAPITKALVALVAAAITSAQPFPGQNEIQIQGYAGGIDNCNGASQPLNLRANECQEVANDLRRFGNGGFNNGFENGYGNGGSQGCVFFFNNPQCQDQELGRFTAGERCFDPLGLFNNGGGYGGYNGGGFDNGFGNGPNGACYSPSCNPAECGRY